jgi:hypothetical protein
MEYRTYEIQWYNITNKIYNINTCNFNIGFYEDILS